MACCGCEDIPARITNVYRHLELSSMFADVTGIMFTSNTFICDPCVQQLEAAYRFKGRCLSIYNKNAEVESLDSSLQLSEAKDDTSNDMVHDEIIFYADNEYVGDEHNSTETDDVQTTEGAIVETYEEYVEEDEAVSSKIRTTYSSELKQEAVEFAELTSNRQAGKLLSIDESCIRKWRNKKDSSSTADLSSNETTVSMTFDEQTVVEQFSLIESCEAIETKENQVKAAKIRKSYTCAQKLDVVKCAEMTGNRKAAKMFSIDESCIRKWRLNKEQLIEIDRERGTKRKPNLHWPELDKELKAWVKIQMSNGTLLKPAEIKAKSIEIAKELNLTNFKGTSSYIFKFMERYQITGRPPKKQKS